MEHTLYNPKEDPLFQTPYIDQDIAARRRSPRGQILHYRQIHGGFAGTCVKFSFCLPEKDAYAGRFYHFLSPFPGPEEELASLQKQGRDDIVSFCLENGAMFLETNMGAESGTAQPPDPNIVWKSSAAAAEYLRVFAMEYYGCPRPFGYVFGGSGGGYKTLACIENTACWDGAVPYVIGSPVSLPNTVTLHAQGQRTLRNAFGKITDALDAGGSGDPYAGLTGQEAAMLREITAMGFSPDIWFLEAAGQFEDGSLPVLMPTVKMIDPGYFTDFWTQPGYAGAQEGSSAQKDLLRFQTRVKAVHCAAAARAAGPDDRNGVDNAWQKALASAEGSYLELESAPQGADLYLRGVSVTFLSGEGAGMQLRMEQLTGNRITFGKCFGYASVDEVLSKLRPGDTVELSNADYIAVQHYYRHQVPQDPSFHAWDQFRNPDGSPAIPQRAFVMGYGFCGTGTVQNGNIHCKTLLVQALMDADTCPWCAHWYRSLVRRARGSEEDFRVYYMQRCMHGDMENLENNYVVNYLGAHRQALLDISDWVERGIAPAESTVYTYDNGQILPEPSVFARRGLQPGVTLTANGGGCAKIRAGETVLFTARAIAPVGSITGLDFGFGDNRVLPGGMDADFPVKGVLQPFCQEGLSGAEATTWYRFDRPGTYFAAVRVRANRHGDAGLPFTQITNLARARIIVE